MTTEVEDTQIKNAHLFVMASLSPLVKESIDLELYRASADSDGSTTDYILEDAFANLLRDLNTIGLSFDIDMSDYVEDMGRLSLFLQFVQLLLPNTLYTTLKTDAAIFHLVESIVQGSIGDGGSAIETYLTELGGLEGTIPLRPSLADFIDQMYPLISQTANFSDYLRNLVALVHEERPSGVTDEDRLIEYQKVVREVIGNLSDAVNLFESWDIYAELTRLQNYIIRDFIAPDNFSHYAYLLLESENTLPPELVDGYTKKWHHYRVSHPWCFEYYQARGKHDAVIPVSGAWLIMIACFNYAFSHGSLEIYTKKMASLRRYYQGVDTDNTITALFQE